MSIPLPPLLRRLTLIGWVVVWLCGQQIATEHQFAHAHHDVDCIGFLAAASPSDAGSAVVVDLPLRVDVLPALHPVINHSVLPRQIRNRGPPVA